MATFVQSTKRVFADPTSDAKSYHAVDTIDAPPPDEVDATDRDRQSQATYVVINSHDDLQLTVTPRAIQILSELSEVLSLRKNVASSRLTTCCLVPSCIKPGLNKSRVRVNATFTSNFTLF